VNSHGDTTFVTTKLEARCDLDVVARRAESSAGEQAPEERCALAHGRALEGRHAGSRT